MADILIIEDGYQELGRLQRLFDGAGYTVHAADTAEAALRLIAVNDYRLVVLDIGLSDRSGGHVFEVLKQLKEPPLVIIQTGNPSIHLKQRFLDAGVAAYLVKASSAASNESLLGLVKSLLGQSQGAVSENLPLTEFLRRYLNGDSKELFLDARMEMPKCKKCGGSSYEVTFGHKTQLPPLIEGKVVCSNCFAEMDLDLE